MHTGQIIMLTKMMTSADLRFYEFDAGSRFGALALGSVRSSLSV
jgi:hypothetical protein